MRTRVRVWSQIAPFFLSAVLFLSVFFTIVSPMPLMVSSLREKFWKSLLALATNAAIVAWLQPGWSSVYFYVCTVGAVGLLFPALALSKRFLLSYAALFTIVGLVIAGLGLGAGIAAIRGEAWGTLPWDWIRSEIGQSVELAKTMLQFKDGQEEDLPQRVLGQLPQSMVLFGALLLWANVSILIRHNVLRFRDRVGLPADSLSRYAVPESWVWPTLTVTAGAFFLTGTWAAVCQIPMLVAAAFYSAQGLSILLYFMERFKMGPMLRWLAFALVVMFAFPALPALGFFDLWFDFRTKLRQ